MASGSSETVPVVEYVERGRDDVARDLRALFEPLPGSGALTIPAKPAPVAIPATAVHRRRRRESNRTVTVALVIMALIAAVLLIRWAISASARARSNLTAPVAVPLQGAAPPPVTAPAPRGGALGLPAVGASADTVARGGAPSALANAREPVERAPVQPERRPIRPAATRAGASIAEGQTVPASPPALPFDSARQARDVEIAAIRAEIARRSARLDSIAQRVNSLYVAPRPVPGSPPSGAPPPR
jgi:hypothetical protein